MNRKGGPRGQRGSKLGPFLAEVERIVREDAGQVRRRTARVITEHLRALGYEGSQGTVSAHVRVMRAAASADVPARAFTCPDCGMTSHHPQDVDSGFCGKCGTFPEDRARPSANRDNRGPCMT